MKFLSGLTARQGAGVGSAYIAASFGVAGVLTFAFQSISTHILGKTGFAPLALLWSATFLTVQVLWVGATQTLGRFTAVCRDVDQAGDLNASVAEPQFRGGRVEGCEAVP